MIMIFFKVGKVHTCTEKIKQHNQLKAQVISTKLRSMLSLGSGSSTKVLKKRMSRKVRVCSMGCQITGVGWKHPGGPQWENAGALSNPIPILNGVTVALAVHGDDAPTGEPNGKA